MANDRLMSRPESVLLSGVSSCARAEANCSPQAGERARKGAPTKPDSSHPDGELPPSRHSLCGRNSYKAYHKNLRIATWNVRTLLDNTNANRPARRTALVAHELKKYSIDIAALEETRLHGEDSITERGEGYTFFWKGLPEGTPALHGVGFAVKSC